MAYSSTGSNFEIIDKCKTGLGYNVVPPPYTGNFWPPKPDLSGLDEFLNEPIVSEAKVKKPVVETSEAKASADKPKDATAKVKNINGETQLHAKVDGKKVVISEASIRRDLQFRDEGGADCLPNEVIFEQLTLMGAKTTGWNKFSSTIASAVICLTTYKKFNFSKYIFESMLKKLDSVTKFLMHPRNMKRVGKGFSRRVTPLFSTMMVQAQEEIGEGIDILTDPQHTSIIIQPSTSQPSKKQKPRKTKRKDTQVPHLSVLTESVVDEAVNEEMDDRFEIDSLKRRVKKLEKKQRSKTHKLTRLYKVGLSVRVESSDDEGLESSDDEGLGEEDASKQERIIDDLDADEDITFVNDQEMFDADKDLQVKEVVVEQEAEEQQELNEDKKDKLFMELLKKRKKFFAAKRAEEKRNIPPIKAQQREDVETLWKLVKAKYGSTRPEKDYDRNKTPSPALVKAIEETCVTCGGLHPYYECLTTDGNTVNASAATRTYNQ
nr:hypothetical protein [Tanacetum cinerariifolium]